MKLQMNKNDILNKQKYSSKYLNINKSVYSNLPSLPNNIKVGGTDIDNDSYVYADALYQTYLNKDQNGKDIYAQLGIDKDSYSFDFVGIAGDIQKDSINASIYEVGDRIGQIIIMPYPKISFKEVEELSTTERGEGGFGSTGLTN